MELTPDVAQIGRTQAEMRPSDIRADEPDADFGIVVAEATWTAIQAHAHTRLDAEVGGVLLGRLCRDRRETPYLFIDGHVAALEAESRASNVTFTGESWTKIHETIDRDFPGASIVGWYHTHPAFGIFLSEMDVFIHRHFFEAPHQVAIVIDPVANTHGGFAWRAGTPTPQRILIEPADAPSGVDFSTAFRQQARAHQDAALVRPVPGRASLVLTLLAGVAAFVFCCYVLMKWTPLSLDTQPQPTRTLNPFGQ